MSVGGGRATRGWVWQGWVRGPGASMTTMPLLALALWLGLSRQTAAALATPRNWGVQRLPGGNKHWAVSDERETLIIAQNLSDPAFVGLTTHFWFEGGRGPMGRYLTDTMIIRYYVDGEANASLTFTPAMAAGSGVGLESLEYYSADQDAEPRGSKPCAERLQENRHAVLDQCGMDLLDGWPWQNRWTGKGGSEGNWILHLRVPFLRSLRVTAQVASNASHVDPAFRRPDIAAGSTGGGYFMIRGLEGPEEQLRIELGAGALSLPPLRTHRVRLRMQHLANHTPARGEFVPLARFGADGDGAGTSGAVLMLTISLQGMHTVVDDVSAAVPFAHSFEASKKRLQVEMCWWALTTPTASYENGEQLLLGTGMEDFFADSFTLSRLSRTFHNDDAGLTHVHGGPQDRCPNPPGANFSTCAIGFNTEPPERFSAYRIFDKDPLVFDDRLELTVRYLPPGKCSLAPSRPDAGAGEGAGDEAARRTRFDAYAWFYTYER